MQAGRGGRATLLTTHVIEDADALCDGIGVLVKGRFACLGAPARLKAAYGGGFSVEVRFGAGAGAGDGADPATVLIDRLVRCGAAPTVTLVARTPSHALMEAPEGLRLSAAFEVLERARAELGVEDYGVSVATLERVFMRFSRMQEGTEEGEGGLAAGGRA